MKAIWNGRVLAESDNTLVIEGGHDFPPASQNNPGIALTGNKKLYENDVYPPVWER
jgi:hypothetical protein